MEKQKYITLKEAAKISGYAPDYLGQLIRQGKIPGKQIYCTIAWITTEEAIRAYLAKSEREHRQPSLGERIAQALRRAKAGLLLGMTPERLLKMALTLSILLSVGFLLVLFYITSVRIEAQLQESAIEEAAQRFGAVLQE